MKRNFQNYIKEYGLELFVSKAIRRQFLNSNSSLGQKINDYNEKLVSEKLQKIFNEEEIDETGLFEVKKKFDTSPIWIMWWQGYDKAPDLVKACINSVKRNNSSRPVIVLSESNYEEYIGIPKHVKEKYELGYITVTHLSDMIRVALLYIYGGVWCDATILDVAEIPQKVFDSDFFTIKTGLKTKEPSHGEWTTFFLASQPGNELMRQIAVDHYKFWKQHNELIDYIMFDYIIRMAVQNDKKIAAQIKNVPENNRNVFKLREYLDCHDEWTAEDIKKLKDDTYLFKLSWKDEKIQSKNTLKAIKEL
ncbi:capsular polysaccharide synthesis protein [Lactobacillus delbrueckii subsp. lactis]|uniref:capsular polysaccharide synthesis protein n=1 Tax=Lactobacillus delbrueckii TaxID=1584 RepID=UPI001E5A7949|nr:capsular polysaccharide synthesis protein [Lactobacillus delbrueckii]MCD5442779.1 capsular polysaccharide synthesis protein [Lactobacillus delbrueckii subsp. lactis]